MSATFGLNQIQELMIGFDKIDILWMEGDVVSVTIPPSLQSSSGLLYAATFKLEYSKEYQNERLTKI